MRRLSALLAFVLIATTAQAAPVPVSPRTIEANPVELLVDPSGTALASWRGLRGADADHTSAFHALASRTPQGRWQAPLYLPRTVFATDIALAQAGRFDLVTTREQPLSGHRTRSQMTVAAGTLSPLKLGATRVVTTGPPMKISYDGPHPTLFTPLVAATAKGTVVIAWQRSAPHTSSGIWIATRQPNGTWTQPRLLGPYGGTPSLALAPDGSGLLTWRRGSLILARTRSKSGSWSPIERAAVPGRYVEVAAPALAGADGHWAFADDVVTRSANAVQSRPDIHVRIPGVGWRGRTLDNASFTPTGNTSYVTDSLRAFATMTGDGGIHAAWPAVLNGTMRLATADVSASASGVQLSAGQTFPNQNVALDDAAAGPGAAWAVSFFDGSSNLADIAARTTTRLSSERALLGSQVAYDPQTGKPVVIWSQGSAQAGYQIVSSS